MDQTALQQGSYFLSCMGGGGGLKNTAKNMPNTAVNASFQPEKHFLNLQMRNAWDAGSRDFKCEPEITELHMEIKINKKNCFYTCTMIVWNKARIKSRVSQLCYSPLRRVHEVCGVSSPHPKTEGLLCTQERLVTFLDCAGHQLSIGLL